MIEENLSKLGFSPSEIKIYLHLLKNGSSWANKISSETKINRTNVYEALDRLISKGIASSITKNKVKWYESKSPDSITSIINEKGEELNHLRSQLAKDIAGLRKMQSEKNPLEATIFTGKKGLRMLFDEILDIGKPISLIAAELKFRNFFGPYFELWHKMRIERGIKQRTIFAKKFKTLEKRRLLQYKFVDDKYTNPTTTIIYGDNCLFIQWDTEPIAIKISSRNIAKSHLNYFNMLWNS